MVSFPKSEDKTDKSTTVTAMSNSRGRYSGQKKKRTGRPLKNFLSMLSPNNKHRKRMASLGTMDTAESYFSCSSESGGGVSGGGSNSYGEEAAAAAAAFSASGALVVAATESPPRRRAFVSDRQIDDLPSQVDLVPEEEISEFLAGEDSQVDNDKGGDNDSPGDEAEEATKDYHFFYERAIRNATDGQYERSLHELNRGLRIFTASMVGNREGGDSGNEFYRKLVLFRANLLARLGSFSESLDDYRSILEEVDDENNAGGDNGDGVGESPVAFNSAPSTRTAYDAADRANLLYACGRLCTHLRRYREAMEYHHRELELTKWLVLGASAAGSIGSDPVTENGTILSRIYHDLAVLCSRSCDPDGALSYYQRALDVETAVWERARQAAALSQQGAGNRCRDEGRGESHDSSLRRHPNRVEEEFEYEAAVATACRREVREAARQIRETKQKMGRILFERGEVDRAVEISIQGHWPALGLH